MKRLCTLGWKINFGIRVLQEVVTMRRVVHGGSLARFTDEKK